MSWVNWENIVMGTLGVLDAAIVFLPVGELAKQTAKAVINTCRTGLLEAVHPDVILSGPADGIPARFTDESTKP